MESHVQSMMVGIWPRGTYLSREAGAAFYVFVGKFTLADFHSAPPARDVCVCVCVCVCMCVCVCAHA